MLWTIRHLFTHSLTFLPDDAVPSGYETGGSSVHAWEGVAHRVLVPRAGILIGTEESR